MSSCEGTHLQPIGLCGVGDQRAHNVEAVMSQQACEYNHISLNSTTQITKAARVSRRQVQVEFAHFRRVFGETDGWIL